MPEPKIYFFTRFFVKSNSYIKQGSY